MSTPRNHRWPSLCRWSQGGGWAVLEKSCLSFVRCIYRRLPKGRCVYIIYYIYIHIHIHIHTYTFICEFFCLQGLQEQPRRRFDPASSCLMSWLRAQKLGPQLQPASMLTLQGPMPCSSCRWNIAGETLPNPIRKSDLHETALRSYFVWV